MSTATVIGALVHAQAQSFRDRAAILGTDSIALSYGELAGRLDRWSAALAALGLGRSARVGLCLPTGPELAVALLAVSSHTVCAPLNPNSPAAQLARDDADLGLDLLITSQARCVQLQQLGVRATWVDPNTIVTAPGIRHSADTAAEPVRSGDTALLLRTSGTTGRPKVVPLSHDNLRAAADNVRRTLALTPEDRCLDIMPLWHVHGFVAGLLASLAAGASIVCAPPIAAQEFPDLLHRTAATWYTAAPALHHAILDAMADRPSLPHQLRFVRSSSSRLPRALATKLEDTFAVPVIEAYGMTEAAHQIASNPLPPGHRKHRSVGGATGVRIAILGPSGEPLATGEEGEVAIRDGSVFGGYENDPTGGSAFVDGWFRTGDLGRLDADGYLFLTGRIREMINRGGQTIAPREVDETLLDHPEVADAIAFGVPHPRLGEVVAAAVVTRPGSRLTETALQHFARTRLDPAKVPARIALVARLPRNATGKPRYAELQQLIADPRHLAEPDGNIADLARQLAQTWAELLHADKVGLAESLSELGSDSLLCTRIANRISATFGVQIPMVELLVADTVAEQATLVDLYMAAEAKEMR